MAETDVLRRGQLLPAHFDSAQRRLSETPNNRQKGSG